MPEIIRPISWNRSQLYWVYMLAGLVVWAVMLMPLMNVAGAVGFILAFIASFVSAIPTPLIVKRRKCFHQLLPLIVSAPVAVVTAAAVNALAGFVGLLVLLLLISTNVRVTTIEYHYGGNACPSCGYDIPNMNDRCPECGRVIEWT